MEGRIWLINHNGSADLHTPFHLPLQVPRIDSQVSRIERWVLPSEFSKIGPQILPPFPSGISKIFAHPLELLLSLIEVNKQVVLFTRMPNFVSFMYFLLNSITDKRIPYANSLCALVTNLFCEFHVFSVEFYNRWIPWFLNEFRSTKFAYLSLQ